MVIGYRDIKEIELCNAVGEFTPIEDEMENCLPFPKEQMNFIIKYDATSEDIDLIKEDLARIYPDAKVELPEMRSDSRVFRALKSGARSAIIDSSQFDREVVVDGEKTTGIKIKGCRMLSWPPIPSPHSPERRNGMPFPETFTAYDEDGNEFETIKDQPWGMTVEDATNEVVMSLFLHDIGIPTNVAGLGVGSYSGSFYLGAPNITTATRRGQMGTAALAVFGTDERVSDLILNTPLPSDTMEPNISWEEAVKILTNFYQLSEELGTDYYELFNETIFHESGEILNKMHSLGIMHGPRQSHYMNYTKPKKEDKNLRVCDFESSEIIKHMTDIQALKSMRDDLYGLVSDANRIYLVVVKSVEKVYKCKKLPEDFDAKEILVQLVKREPADAVICGYTNDEIGLEDLKGYKPHELEYEVIKRTRKDSLMSIKDAYDELFARITPRP